MATKRPTFKRFELLSKLGAGLHGRVYLAWDPQLQRKVALKLLTQGRNAKATAEQFLAEARAVAKVAHAAVVPLFEAGIEAGVPYLVFEFVEGVPLRDHLMKTPLDSCAAISYFRQIVDGVAAAHTLGIAHLDLSPNNVLVDARGALRIMDFGLARILGDAREFDEDDVQGTPRYMSPEHFESGVFDLRTDVFALGLIFFELLSGAPAVDASTFKELRAQLSNARFDWTRLDGRAIPTEVISVVRDALARKAPHRFAHAGEMQGALAAAVTAGAARENRDLAVQFLLRRLQRRPEFPAFSNSINEINRLTGEQSQANLEELSKVIMRDFSLTNRLMKVANSALFSRSDGGTVTVTQAISRIGTKTVRMLCNGLLMFEHLKGTSQILQSALVESFVAGLLGRLLATQVNREAIDEAFVAAMFNQLGRNLLIYYLEDEYLEIQAKAAHGMLIQDAERAVLATTTHELGAAVAATWKFPVPLIATIERLPEGVLPAPTSVAERMRYLAHFPNELCSLAARVSDDDAERTLTRMSERYARCFRTTPESLLGLIELALEKFAEIAPSLNVAADNLFCASANRLVAEFRREQATPLELALA